MTVCRGGVNAIETLTIATTYREQWWQVCECGGGDDYLQQQYTKLFRNTQDYTQQHTRLYIAITR